MAGGVRQLRLVGTAEDYEEAVRCHRDVLGMPEEGTFSAEGGHVTSTRSRWAHLSGFD
jgi:hypothetical protein